MLRVILFAWLLFFCTPFGYSQTNSDSQLAGYYFTNGEFDKALLYYEKIYSIDPSKVNFHKYYECLLATEKYKDAEKLLKSATKKYDNDIDFQFLVADFYDKSNQLDKKEKEYEKIIESIQPSELIVKTIFQNFLSINEFDKALQTLNKGKKILKNQNGFELEYASYYHRVGDENKLFDYLFEFIKEKPIYIDLVQTQLNSYFDLSDKNSPSYNALKDRLLQAIQKNPDNLAFNQLLIWLFLQSQNYQGALIQVIALDKRTLNSDGSAIYQLGLDCIEYKAYDVATKAFKAIIEKGQSNNLFVLAYYQYLNASFRNITENKSYSKEQLAELIIEYDKVIKLYTNPQTTLQLNLQKVSILAYYLDESSIAIQQLNELIENPRIRDINKATCKMKLADIYLLDGDIWEASLLYMQIDNDFKYEEIGQEAKLKNARVYYYEGEYEYAQSQLDVLKQSTSKLIANDAMELSILITENLGLDSNYQAMNWFSRAELAIAKHDFTTAENYLDSIQLTYPYHDLADEILFKKATIEKEQGNWAMAITYFQQIIERYPQDILADNSIFEIASIYHYQLNEPEKAKEYYKKILFDYKGSLFVEEARKRYRVLRGDLIEEP